MWQKHVSFRPLRWSNIQFVIPGHQIFKNSDHKNPIGQIRWPIIFFSSCMICTAEKLSICLYFSILGILSFQCPGMTHITNLTRMPQEGVNCFKTWNEPSRTIHMSHSHPPPNPTLMQSDQWAVNVFENNLVEPYFSPCIITFEGKVMGWDGIYCG